VASRLLCSIRMDIEWVKSALPTSTSNGERLEKLSIAASHVHRTETTHSYVGLDIQVAERRSCQVGIWSKIFILSSTAKMVTHGMTMSSKLGFTCRNRLQSERGFLAAGVRFFGAVQFFLCVFSFVLCTEATPQMPKLSLLLMLDGEATDSESNALFYCIIISFECLLVDEFELE
jgi:hypothetical protein